MPRHLIAVLVAIATLSQLDGLRADPPAAETPTAPWRQAHAHNDYLHARPLHDALDRGFTSVEADIFLVDGQLLVAHTRREIEPGRTLQKLYLDPLRQRVKEAGGAVHRRAAGQDVGPFHLLVDIKSDAEPTYRALAKALADYDDIITSVHDGKVSQKAVNVTISGNRPIDLMKSESPRFAGIDGRWEDLDSDLPAHLMPLISDHWFKHFRWTGHGDISKSEQDKLLDAVRRAHAQGRRIRFWATPDNAEVWSALRTAGVDHINTDDLAGLAAFLRAQEN